jgi:error-prone DNA polymerase
MGFYHPATLIRDAAQHEVCTLPVDVQRSEWGCTLERKVGGELSVRLGLKYVGGMRAKIGRAIVAERHARPFTSLVDFRARVNASADLCATLAEIGAFASLGDLGRREALWQVEALARSGELFARVPPEPLADTSWLPEASPQEEMLADLRATSVTTGPHPLSFLRPMLEREGIISAAELAKKHDGERARVAGVVVVRQRPATAKGIVFVTVEDETGFANAVVMPDDFARWRTLILGHPALVIEGRVQNRDHVVTLKPDGFSPLPGGPVDDRWARDFH